MPLEEFIIGGSCWVDDHLARVPLQHPLRRRGFSPQLSDTEVITMELVGEFRGNDADQHIWEYFSSHWRDLFPRLGSRSQFAKQSLNLCQMKQHLQGQLMAELGSTGDPIHLVDGLPLPVCHFRRAKHCSRFKGSGSYGYCASKREAYFGFEDYLLVDLRGVIAGFTLTPANESEREAVWELTDTVKGGLLLGDKGDLGAAFQGELLQFRQIELEAPVRHNMRDPLTKPWRNCLNQLRRRVETTIGQLVERFNIQKIRVRTLWSLTNRLTRKWLTHSLAVLANIENGLEPLQLSKTIRY